MRDIDQGTGLELDFEMPLIGHPRCNKYTGVSGIERPSRCLIFDDHVTLCRVCSKRRLSGGRFGTGTGPSGSSCHGR